MARTDHATTGRPPVNRARLALGWVLVACIALIAAGGVAALIIAVWP
jgi:hypothetical protein